MSERQQPNDDADRLSDTVSADDSGQPLTIFSADLFQGRQEIQIRHGEDCYRLRITRNGKLILNK